MIKIPVLKRVSEINQYDMAIIKNIDQLKLTVKVNKSLPWSSISPYLEDAQDIYLIPYLGFKIVDKLENLDESSTSEDEGLLRAILSRVRRVLGPFAVLTGSAELSIMMGDSGHTVSKSDTSTPASDAKIEKADNNLESRAWQNLEILLQYMESNISKYPDWKESDYYKNKQTRFFDNSIQFQDQGLINIEYKRLTFEKLRQLIIRIEKTEITTLITPAIDAIILDPDPDDAKEKKRLLLLERIRAYIGARVGELHTSTTTRVQRSKNNSLEYKPVIRPLYEDIANTGNYYVQQVAFWNTKILESIVDMGVELGSANPKWNDEDKRIIVAEG